MGLASPVLAINKIDSIKAIIITCPDGINKIDLLNKLSDLYQSNNTNLGIFYAEKAIDYSKKINYINGEILGLQYLADNYFVLGKNNLMIEKFDEAIKLADESQSKNLLADIYTDYGHKLNLSLNFDKSMDNLLKAMSIYKENNNEKGLISIYCAFGRLYAPHNNDLAIENYKTAESLAEKISLQMELPLIYANLAYCYFKDSNQKLAVEYYNLAENSALATNNCKTIIETFHNISFYYLDKNEPDSALACLQKALTLSCDYFSLIVLGDIYTKIGHIYGLKGEFKSDLEYNLKALKLRSEIGIPRLYCSSMTNVGTSYFNLKQYDSALRYYHLSLSELKTMDKVNALIALNLKKTYKLFEVLNNNDSMLAVLKEYLIYQEKASNDENQIMAYTKHFNYEIQLNQKELELRKNQNYYFAAIIILIIALSIFVLKRYFDTHKINKVLNKQKVELTSTNSELNQSRHKLSELNNELEIRYSKINNLLSEVSDSKKIIEDKAKMLTDLNSTKDKLFSIISHDLRNPFTVLMNNSKYLNDNFDLLIQEDKTRLISGISSSSQNIYHLLDSLLLWSKSQTGHIAFKPEQIDLYEIIYQCIFLFNDQVKEKNIRLHTDIQIGSIIFADNFMISTIIRNLLSNALKFTDDSGEIFISNNRQNGSSVISVIDNGIGMPEDVMDNLFKIGSSHIRKGTKKEKGSGLGLLICKEFIEIHKGKISAKSKQGEGSEFLVHIPVIN